MLENCFLPQEGIVPLKSDGEAGAGAPGIKLAEYEKETELYENIYSPLRMQNE